MPYYHLAALLAHANDREGYRRVCSRIGAQFSQEQAPMIAERMAKACLLEPDAGVDGGVVSNLVNTAIAGRPRRRLPDEVLLVRALGELRAGRFSNAVDWVPKTMNSETDPWRSVQALMISALAQKALGHDDIARSTLDQGLRTANSHIPRARVRDFGSSWSEWLIANVLTREAQASIEGAEQ